VADLPIVLGYWRDEGYDVKVITVGGSLQGIQQMVGGAVDFAQLNSTGLIQANTENNVAVRGLMGNGVIDWGMGVMQDGPIKSVADLKGKKIGIFSLGTGGVPLLKGYLRSNGINPDTDVQIIATGAGAPALEALKSDRVQALMFWGSALAGFENAGTKMRVLFDPAWRALPDFTFGTLQKTIDTDPAMVEAISRGAAKATLFARPTRCALKLHWKNYPSTKPTGADEATLVSWDMRLLDAQLQSMKGAFDMNGGKLIGAMDPAAYGRMQDFMLKDGTIKRTVRARVAADQQARLRRCDQPLRPQGRDRRRQGLRWRMTPAQFIAGLPKAELHMHIEGSIEPAAVHRTGEAQQRDDRLEDRSRAARGLQLRNLQSFLDLYYDGCRVLVHALTSRT
jgi:NitT/TauT family transport system substrate-binding protein